MPMSRVIFSNCDSCFLSIIEKMTGLRKSLYGPGRANHVQPLWRRCFRLFALIFATSLFGCLQSATAADTPATSTPKSNAPEVAFKNAWKLDQRSRVLGDVTIFICPTGIKAVNRKDKLTVVCAAPYAEVVTYSLRTGKICKQTFARSDNPYAKAVAMFSGIAHAQVPVVKTRTYQKGGLTWSDFKITEEYKKQRQAMWKKHEVTGSEPAYGNLVVFSLPMDKRAIDWLARLYCVPKTGMIPFDVTFWDVDNEVHSLVKTFSMVSTRLTASDFKIPGGLHPVKDPRSVIQDETANDAIEMMMGGSK